jgi:hypothetical protein
LSSVARSPAKHSKAKAAAREGVRLDRVFPFCGRRRSEIPAAPRWAAGTLCDVEQGDGESGIADQDGLDEQVPFRDWMMVWMV